MGFGYTAVHLCMPNTSTEKDAKLGGMGADTTLPRCTTTSTLSVDEDCAASTRSGVWESSRRARPTPIHSSAELPTCIMMGDKASQQTALGWLGWVDG